MTNMPYEEHKELRSGLPTGAGGNIGEDNADTWSLYEQEQAHAARGTPIAAPTPAPQPDPPAAKTSKKGNT